MHTSSRNYTVSVLLPLAGLFALIALAYSGQRLVQAIGARSAQLLDLNLIYLGFGTSAITNLLTTGILLGLFWVVMRHSSKWVGVVFCVIGIGLLVYPIGYFYFLQQVHEIAPIPILSGAGSLEDILFPGSLFYAVAGGISMVGVLKLLFGLILGILPNLILSSNKCQLKKSPNIR